MEVIRSSFACRVVVDNAFAEAWSFAQLNIPLNDCIKDHIIEMLLDFFNNLVR